MADNGCTENCPIKHELKRDCPCPKKECKYHGLCCECIAAHIKGGRKPPECLADKFKWTKI